MRTAGDAAPTARASVALRRLELYNAGRSAPTIASEDSVSVQAVFQSLKRLEEKGLFVDWRGGGRRAGDPPANERERDERTAAAQRRREVGLLYVGEGLSRAELAERFDVSERQISNDLEREGIIPRVPGRKRLYEDPVPFTCDVCGRSVDPKYPSWARQRRGTCSRACAGVRRMSKLVNVSKLVYSLWPESDWVRQMKIRLKGQKGGLTPAGTGAKRGRPELIVTANDRRDIAELADLGWGRRAIAKRLGKKETLVRKALDERKASAAA